MKTNTVQASSVNLLDELLQKASQPAAFEALIKLVKPRTRPDKRNLVYVLSQVNRIGQLSSELLYLKTLCGEHYDRIIIVTGPTNSIGVNPNVFKIVGSKFIHICTDDPVIPMLGLFNTETTNGITRLEGMDFLIVNAWGLWSLFKKFIASGKQFASFSLPNSMRLKGESWMKNAGMDITTPTVLLHVRDKGYMPELSYHGHRCANIENYRPAINFLEDQGYQIVRLGDQSNPPITGYSKAVIDLPFHEDYDSFLDIYFAATCCFALNQSSGPASIVRGFSKPALMVNVTVNWDFPPATDLLMFKHYKNKITGAELSYEQILNLGLAELSMDEEFEKAGVVLEENTPYELETALREFVSIQRGEKRLNKSIQEPFYITSQKHEKEVLENPEQTGKHTQVFGFAHRLTNISEQFLTLNPSFLSIESEKSKELI